MVLSSLSNVYIYSDVTTIRRKSMLTHTLMQNLISRIFSIEQHSKTNLKRFCCCCCLYFHCCCCRRRRLLYVFSIHIFYFLFLANRLFFLYFRLVFYFRALFSVHIRSPYILVVWVCVRAKVRKSKSNFPFRFSFFFPLSLSTFFPFGSFHSFCMSFTIA